MNHNFISNIRLTLRKMIRELGLLSKNDIYDIPLSHRHILIELELYNTLTNDQLASILNVDKSTLSRVVKIMLQKNLIVSVIDHNDNRYKHIQLSDLGKKILHKINAIASKQVSETLQILSQSEIETVLNGIKLYANALQKARINSQYTIRSILKKDNKAMAELVKKVLKEFNADRPGTAYNDAELENLFKAYSVKNSVYLVIEHKISKKIVGGCGIAQLEGEENDVCELRKMYLHDQIRGLGLGTVLLDKILIQARNHNYKLCYLETLSNMKCAIKLYEKQGFKIIKGRMGDTSHYACDIRMLKDLICSAQDKNHKTPPELDNCVVRRYINFLIEVGKEVNLSVIKSKPYLK